MALVGPAGPFVPVPPVGRFNRQATASASSDTLGRSRRPTGVSVSSVKSSPTSHPSIVANTRQSSSQLGQAPEPSPHGCTDASSTATPAVSGFPDAPASPTSTRLRPSSRATGPSAPVPTGSGGPAVTAATFIPATSSTRTVPCPVESAPATAAQAPSELTATAVGASRPDAAKPTAVSVPAPRSAVSSPAVESARTASSRCSPPDAATDAAATTSPPTATTAAVEAPALIRCALPSGQKATQPEPSANVASACGSAPTVTVEVSDVDESAPASALASQP